MKCHAPCFVIAVREVGDELPAVAKIRNRAARATANGSQEIPASGLTLDNLRHLILPNKLFFAINWSYASRSHFVRGQKRLLIRQASGEDCQHSAISKIDFHSARDLTFILEDDCEYWFGLRLIEAVC